MWPTRKLKAFVADEVKDFRINGFVNPSTSFCVSDNVIQRFVKLINAVSNGRAVIAFKCNTNNSVGRVNGSDGARTCKAVVG